MLSCLCSWRIEGDYRARFQFLSRNHLAEKPATSMRWRVLYLCDFAPNGRRSGQIKSKVSRSLPQKSYSRTASFVVLGHSHTATATATSIPASCATMKMGTPSGRNPGKRVGKGARNGDCRISEGCGSREPICRSDVETHRKRNSRRCSCNTTEDCQQQPQCSDSLRKPLSTTCAAGHRELPKR